MSGLFLYILAAITLFNILRMAIFLIGADIYDMKRHRALRDQAPSIRKRAQTVSIIIPAYNEEKVIVRCITSVLESSYNNYRVVVVNDGSKDSTFNKARYFIRKNNLQDKVKLVTQKNQGKGHALNNGINKHVKKGLVMVLDADSTIAPDAIKLAVEYFDQNPDIVAASANIKVMPGKKAIGIMQEYEYIISNRMRKSFNVVNSEYVIGGVGSMFRLSAIKKAGYYSSDTITEDLDLTFKLIQLGNIKHRIGYASNVHAYTEGVMSLGELMKQRFRWKFGRYQAYAKHRNLFFSKSPKIDKRLSRLMLPYTILSDVLFLFEPVILAAMVALAIYTNGSVVFLHAYLIITAYVCLHLIFDNTLQTQRKLVLLALSPLLYFMLLIASFIEYTALLRSIAKIPTIGKEDEATTGSWEHVRRSGQTA